MNWTQNEEHQLVKLIQSGSNINTISTKHNRTIDDITNRLGKIIYENMNSGNGPKLISSILNMPENKVMEYYNTYKNKTDTSLSMTGGFVDNAIKKMENNNKILKLIIENKKLQGQLNTLIKNGKLSPNIKEIISKLKNLC